MAERWLQSYLYIFVLVGTNSVNNEDTFSILMLLICAFGGIFLTVFFVLAFLLGMIQLMVFGEIYLGGKGVIDGIKSGWLLMKKNWVEIFVAELLWTVIVSILSMPVGFLFAALSFMTILLQEVVNSFILYSLVTTLTYSVMQLVWTGPFMALQYSYYTIVYDAIKKLQSK
jgi:hypothetical protein